MQNGLACADWSWDTILSLLDEGQGPSSRIENTSHGMETPREIAEV